MRNNISMLSDLKETYIHNRKMANEYLKKVQEAVKQDDPNEVNMLWRLYCHHLQKALDAENSALWRMIESVRKENNRADEFVTWWDSE